jgi:hypothetical protein
VWDGRRNDGEYAKEGRYRVQITPTDRAGNVGLPATGKVLVLNAMRAPSFRPGFFYPADGDALSASATLGARLTKASRMSWLIRDTAGNVVRHGGEGITAQPGMVRFEWDGRDDAGQFVPEGRYVGRIRVTRPSGSYGHDVAVRVMPFDLEPATWKPRQGDEVRLWFTSAEPLRGKPIVMARLPGLTKAPLRVIKVDHTTFKALLPTAAALRPGRITIRAIGTDSGAGVQSQTWALRLD